MVYRRKPVEVEDWSRIVEGGTANVGLDPSRPGLPQILRVSTPIGRVVSFAGDWIVRHADGSLLVIPSPDFDAEYEPA